VFDTPGKHPGDTSGDPPLWTGGEFGAEAGAAIFLLANFTDEFLALFAAERRQASPEAGGGAGAAPAHPARAP
jgi:hypothetical protein